MSRLRYLFCSLLLIACVHSAWLPAQQPKNKDLASPPLAINFGEDPQSRLVATAGQFIAAKEKTLNGYVITSVDKTPLVLESATVQEGAREVRALVRLRGDLSPAPTFAISVAKRDVKDPGLRMNFTSRKDGDSIGCTVSENGKPLHDLKALAEKMDWAPDRHNGFTFYPRAYPLDEIRPGWPDDFRARIELDMSALPDVNNKWISVRIELQPGRVRFWLHDHLVATKDDSGIDINGSTQIAVGPGVQLANYAVAPVKPTKGFLPIHLDGYTNGRAFMGSTVKPDALTSGAIDGIPFVFPSLNVEGKDHIDIGRSLYRHANMEGYIQSLGHRSIGSTRHDPARIQLRIPNGTYDALYLVAAASGEANTVPMITAMFYRPSAGYAQNFETNVPLATADLKELSKVPVTLANNKQVNLWLVKIPLDPAKLASFSDMDIIEVELTKKVHQFRSYPDPINYGWHQAGPPSSVHVFGATLAEAPWKFELNPEKFGHVWTAPEVPAYLVKLTNRTEGELRAKVTVRTQSHDGTETTNRATVVRIAAGLTSNERLEIPVKLNGIHKIAATVEIDGKSWTEERSLCRLAPDTRSEKWTPGKGALFGYWSYHGGHYAPKGEHHVNLMTLAGARTSIGLSQPNNPLVKKHWAPIQAGAWEVRPQAWAREEPYDPQKYANYQKEVIAAFTKARNAVPEQFRPDHVYFFPEPHISSRLTEGNLASYWGDAEPPLTEAEKVSLRMFAVTAKCAAEAVRKEFPNLKILIPWGDPLFIPPILRAGFPKELIDGSGLDVPGFERLPEMQLHQNAIHRLYQLRKEFEKAGIQKPMLQYVEGIFVPTEPGAVSYREQMDIYQRWTLMSMAYGVDRFYSGWFAFDCGNYYGTEHYGGCGIQRRIPYCDPKPAYAAYATMTDKLNEANFDGWEKTGSLTTFCLRFTKPKPQGESSNPGDSKTYALWTLRGKRPVTFTLDADGEVHVTDSMNNTKVLKTKDKQASFVSDASVQYVRTTSPLKSIVTGEPDHSDAQPAPGAQQIADLGDGSWGFTDKPDKIYEQGSFSIARYHGKFSASVAADDVHGKVLVSNLEKQEKVHELMPWYNVLASKKKALAIPGAPSHLGLWVKGSSDWGRAVYVLRDAKGEKWTSIGFQDQYNCDDPHSWSSFNFDGWRYLRFELPGHTGFDNYRKHGTTWWRSDGGDNIVDLPLTLENIIVEQRTHILYVNDVQPVASDSVRFGKLFVEYENPADATPQAVAQSKLRMILPKGALDLPNPIANLQKEGMGAPVKISKLEPPIEHNDGTTIHVQFEGSKEAAKHFIWCGVRADGKGAINMTPAGAKSNVLLRGLRPGGPFYFWVTYTDAQGKLSKPSEAMSAVLVDTFSQK